MRTMQEIAVELRAVADVLDGDLPSASISVSPPAIRFGESAELRWATTNATSVKINGVPYSLAEVRTVIPMSTSDYELIATGPGGKAMASARLTVTPPPNA